MSTKSANDSQCCGCNKCSQEELYEQIDNVIDLYKDKEGNLIQILHLAQEINGFLPLELQKHIASKLNLPLSEVSGVVTFYSFFSTKPRGKHTIRVCMGTACYVRGGKKIVEGLMDKLGVDIGETTEDGMFTLEIARCIGACGLAPAMMIDDMVYKQVSVNTLGSILGEYIKA